VAEDITEVLVKQMEEGGRFFRSALWVRNSSKEKNIMGILKRIARSLFGSSPSSGRKTARAAVKSRKKAVKKMKPSPKTRKTPGKKIAARKSRKKTITAKAKKTAKAKTARSRKPAKVAKKAKGAASQKQPAMVKEALAILPVGKVTHYFPHVCAAVIRISQGTIRQGEVLSFRGHTTNFKQAADSMQIDRQPIRIARTGDEIGIRVRSRVRAGDLVYKV